jgi:invasion protein IalB
MQMTLKPWAVLRCLAGTALVSAFLALGALPSHAQDAAAPTTEAQPSAGEAQLAPAAAAPAAAPATAEAVPQPEWQKVCGPVKDQQECHTSRQRLTATGQAIAQVMLIERGDKKLMQIAVPPITLIQPGVQVKIDTQEAVGVKYVVCTPGECLALGEINPEFIGKLKKGNKLVISMLNPQGKPVNFDMSLAGFTAVYDGPGIDPAQAQANQQRLEAELKRKADEARQQLMQAQQQQSTTQ